MVQSEQVARAVRARPEVRVEAQGQRAEVVVQEAKAVPGAAGPPPSQPLIAASSPCLTVKRAHFPYRSEIVVSRPDVILTWGLAPPLTTLVARPVNVGATEEWQRRPAVRVDLTLTRLV